MELTREQQEYLDLRDKRTLALDRALLVEQEIRDSRTLQAIVDAIGADADQAMYEFAFINPMDRLAVGALQARVHRLVYLRETINQIRQDGEAAGLSLSETTPYMSDPYE